MKKKFIKTPLVGVQVHGAKDVGTRTVNLLMGEHAGEYVRGDIMDANAVIQAFDEIKGSVDTDHDSLEEIIDEIHDLRDATDQNFEVFQEKVEEEIANRTQGDKFLDEKINTEKQERVNADTQLRNDLTTEVNRAKGQEAYLQNLVNTKADTTALDGAKSELDKKISDETTRATGVEATKASADDLTAEIARAKQAEAAIISDVAEKLAQKADSDTLANYALKTELPTVPTKVSELQNDSEFIVKSVYDEKIAALEARIAALEAKHPEAAE